jgi:hypothetical protein
MAEFLVAPRRRDSPGMQVRHTRLMLHSLSGRFPPCMRVGNWLTIPADKQLWKATAPMIALGLMAVVAVYVVASEQSPAVSVRAQAGSWVADHTGMKMAKMNIAKRTSKLDWGGAEEYMADDAAKIASNQANIFDPEFGITPPPINKGYLDEIEQAEGEQTQETVDNAALARVSCACTFARQQRKALRLVSSAVLFLILLRAIGGTVWTERED